MMMMNVIEKGNQLLINCIDQMHATTFAMEKK
jgi:hypothetical protein